MWYNFDLGLYDLLHANDSFNIVVSGSCSRLTLGVVKTHVTHFGFKVLLCPLKITWKHHGISLILELIAFYWLTFVEIPLRFIVVGL